MKSSVIVMQGPDLKEESLPPSAALQIKKEKLWTSLCSKIFRLRYKRTRHVVRIPQNIRRKSTIYFGLFNVA